MSTIYASFQYGVSDAMKMLRNCNFYEPWLISVLIGEWNPRLEENRAYVAGKVSLLVGVSLIET